MDATDRWTRLLLGPAKTSWLSGTRAIVGDFNGDGYSDIAFLGPAGSTSIPVPRFSGWASDTRASAFTGRVNN